MASLNIAGVRKPAAKGHGGAHVAHHKNTSAMPVERMPVPASVIALRMPKKYKARKVRKWQKKYDGMLK